MDKVEPMYCSRFARLKKKNFVLVLQVYFTITLHFVLHFKIHGIFFFSLRRSVTYFPLLGTRHSLLIKKELGDHLNYASVIIIDKDDYSPAPSKAPDLTRIILNSCH